jgi:hypothetical protein
LETERVRGGAIRASFEVEHAAWRRIRYEGEDPGNAWR